MPFNGFSFALNDPPVDPPGTDDDNAAGGHQDDGDGDGGQELEPELEDDLSGDDEDDNQDQEEPEPAEEQDDVSMDTTPQASSPQSPVMIMPLHDIIPLPDIET
ncbi:hypothetical protein BG011_000849 [Mortierella polycephala]|uniref:Uncharacterized protein n=1 Tax=Mortierella polycephala TaxID=41804 RepID=A0A9P6U9S9_9FUNG|nr:hypothetical protein BG011_000849 [Mortierella polycephala]